MQVKGLATVDGWRMRGLREVVRGHTCSVEGIRRQNEKIRRVNRIKIGRRG